MGTGISTLSQAQTQIKNLAEQQSLLNSLANQLATGKKTQKFSGLGNDALTTLRARADLSSLNAYSQNITNASRRMALMGNAIGEFKSQTSTISSSMLLFSQESYHQSGDEIFYDDPLTAEVEKIRVGLTSADPSVELQTMTDLADNLYDVVVSLLNSKDGDSYILNGSDTQTKPLNDSGLLDSAMTKLITQWKEGTISNEELIADLTSGDNSTNLDAIDDSTIGFSAALSSGNVADVSVRASETIEVDYTVRANEDPFRDILVGLAFLKNATLSPMVDAYIEPNAYPNAPDVQGAPGDTIGEMQDNFFEVFNAVQTMVAEAAGKVDGVSYRIETANARVQELKEKHTNTKNMLTDTVSDIEDVDLNEVAVKISSLQVQLEASYAVTAQVQQLSLVNFI